MKGTAAVGIRGEMTLALIGLAISACGTTTQQPDNLNCLLELELPRYASVSNVPNGGEVAATVVLGQDGRPADYEFEATDRSLMLEVRYHLRDKATYDPACAGKKIRLKFTFEVAGDPVQHGWAETRFRPPNHFVIVTQPRAPKVLVIPVEPKGSNDKIPESVQ